MGEEGSFSQAQPPGAMAGAPLIRAKEAKENAYNDTFGQPTKW
jgi:hypothetical protein